MINKIVDLFKSFIYGGKPLALELTEIVEEEKKNQTIVEKTEVVVEKPKRGRKPKNSTNK